MNGYRTKEPGSFALETDLWAPYRGKYPEPTHEELLLIHPFLCKFNFEDDDFDQHSDSRWIPFKESLRIPHLRSKLLRFLTQVRQSKGYDVDFYIDSSASAWKSYHVFVPRSLDEKEFCDLAMAATRFAIGEINARLGGKNYEMVKVDKLVSTTNKLLLLSFTVNEIATGELEALQAMVEDTTPFRLRVEIQTTSRSQKLALIFNLVRYHVSTF